MEVVLETEIIMQRGKQMELRHVLEVMSIVLVIEWIWDMRPKKEPRRNQGFGA